MPNTKFRNRFKYHLRRSRYNQKELAHELNIDASAISHRLSGRIPWRTEDLTRVCELMDVGSTEREELFRLAGLFENEDASGFQPPLQRQNRVPHYTRRHDGEVEQILADLRLGSIVTLCGPGGVGKTSLAIEVAWVLTPNRRPPARFPDGIVFHSFYNQPQVSLALEQIVRSFGEEPKPTPRNAAQRLLANRKALLILDGAERADNLQEVLAVRGQCGVLVTSRRREDAEATLYLVEPLPVDRAVQLLERWSSERVNDLDAAREICTLVGNLPLAVCLAGRRMVQYELTATEFLAWLRETPLLALDAEQRQYESVPVLLDHAVARMKPSVQQTLAVVGLLALSPFSEDAVAAALALSTSVVLFLLGELVNNSFLQRINQKYEVSHPLIHAYAQERLAVPKRATEQLAQHFLLLAQHYGEQGQTGFTELDQNRSHLMTILSMSIAKQEWAGSEQGMS
ncbi:hypothetical protein KFU94_03950 [Chloroflexi bacterium TSY]|nr:hypothetical protein [Chloroflexi bacterium TSY]